jgi:hypothetical protein
VKSLELLTAALEGDEAARATLDDLRAAAEADSRESFYRARSESCTHDYYLQDGYLTGSDRCCCGMPLHEVLRTVVDRVGLGQDQASRLLGLLAFNAADPCSSASNTAVAVMRALERAVVAGQRDAWIESEERDSREHAKVYAAVTRRLRRRRATLLQRLRTIKADVEHVRYEDRRGDCPRMSAQEWDTWLAGFDKVSLVLLDPPKRPARGRPEEAAARELRRAVVEILAKHGVPSGGGRAARILNECHEAVFGSTLKDPRRETMRARRTLPFRQ